MECGCEKHECEKFNGYPNRETWALSLHLTNTQWMYDRLYEIIRNTRLKDYQKADELKAMVEEWYYDFFEGVDSPQEIVLMIQDVGSLWRVDWTEVIRANSEE